jgi:hypothetical protein
VTGKSAEVEGDLADAELSFELIEHGAAQIAGKAINSEEKDRSDKYADADENFAEALSLENADLANDLAGEEETRQNAYAAGDAGWLLDEAAANIASTLIAASTTSSFLTGLMAADVVYVTAAAPLITTATQAFNGLVDGAYVAAFPGDTDQAAVSGAWTGYYNTMATAAENAITAAMSAYQGYISGMAGNIQTNMNNVAGESTQLATDEGAALIAYVGPVAAAATLATSQQAAAVVAWVDSAATYVKNAVKNEATAWLQMADDGVDAAKTLLDDYSNFANGFVHSYLGAAVSHATNVINEDRQAAKDVDSELTILAQGVAAEQHDLTLDDLSESKSAALQLSAADDAVINAWAVLESAWSILSAWFTHTETAAAPLSDFASSYPGGSGPMSGLNHNLDLVGGDDEVVMQAALAATSNSQYSQSSFWIQALHGELGRHLTRDELVLLRSANGNTSLLMAVSELLIAIGQYQDPPIAYDGEFDGYCHRWVQGGILETVQTIQSQYRNDITFLDYISPSYWGAVPIWDDHALIKVKLSNGITIYIDRAYNGGSDHIAFSLKDTLRPGAPSRQELFLPIFWQGLGAGTLLPSL